jgi:hypothetical protein
MNLNIKLNVNMNMHMNVNMNLHMNVNMNINIEKKPGFRHIHGHGNPPGGDIDINRNVDTVKSTPNAVRG